MITAVRLVGGPHRHDHPGGPRSGLDRSLLSYHLALSDGRERWPRGRVPHPLRLQPGGERRAGRAGPV